MEVFHLNILNISLVLLSAYIGGALIRKIGYPAILGELLIGIILGPSLLGVIESTESIKVLAEIGIILLMVYIGMEIEFHDLKKASWPGLLAALGGFLVPFALGYYAIVWTGGTPISGLFVAIAIGVTSLATKSRILIDLKLLNTRIAYVLMAGALISDVLALVIFSGITNFAESSSLNLTNLLMIGGKIILFFGITISIGLFVLPRVGSYLSRSGLKNSTAYFTLILIVTFGYCELAELAGMHSILGAFMAGLFLKDKLFSKTISKELNKAFYDVSIGFMAPVFFVSAGFFVDITVFQTDLGLLLLITGLAVVGKIVGTALFYMPSGNGWREGITIGTGMNGRGAVEIIIAEIGLKMGIIDQTIFSILVFMAIFTTLTVPVLLNWTTKWLRKRNELVYMEQRDGVLFLGVNSLSLLMAKYLAPHKPVTMVDNNRTHVTKAREQGFNCILGNALNKETQDELSMEHIHTFIGLTTNSQVNLLAGQMSKDSYLVPNVHVAIVQQEAKAGAELLKRFEASLLFASHPRLAKWFMDIGNDKTEEIKTPVVKEMVCEKWVEQHVKDLNHTLPILVQNPQGKVRTFASGDIMEEGETVIMLQKKG
ncbi:cation:proton antiporter [Carboxylicivirga sediminis]|uniref:Cation:proton antiporter n=1 Tax=Carboxylicivirga sediminis TaxID=2006564 RepID=A0A941F1Q9_9BACT|nr:cation:proton antiporter [Carboxylicivirga sediminis]MBR8534563.1 cation:proton antiporter [Carboxylicivirga sediminis]